MSSISKRISRLRRSLLEEQNFENIAEVFHDEVGDPEEMHEASRAVMHPKLLLTVEGALRQALDSRGRLEHPMLMHVAHTDLFHGAASFQGMLVVFFLLEDEQRGLIMTAGMPTHYLRFSHVDVDPTVDSERPPRAAPAPRGPRS